MDKEKTIAELEQELVDKRNAYRSLLKEIPPLSQVYQKSELAAQIAFVGMLFAIVSLFIGLFPLGLVIAVILCIIYYKRDKHFELSFEEMASDELKKARSEYEECNQRLKAAKKEKQSAKFQEDLQRMQEQSKLMEDEDDDEQTGEEIFIELLTGLYDRELVSSHPIYTVDLSDKIYKNAFAAQAFLDKAVALVGDIIKIDYDKRQKMPYVLIGSGHYLSSDVCDRYACYFTDSKQIATLEKLQTGNMLTICGIFAKSNYEVPSTYFLTQSYILDIR